MNFTVRSRSGPVVLFPRIWARSVQPKCAPGWEVGSLQNTNMMGTQCNARASSPS